MGLFLFVYIYINLPFVLALKQNQATENVDIQSYLLRFGVLGGVQAYLLRRLDV